MLEHLATVLQEGRKYRSCNPLQKAILENDFETFTRTLDLYDFVGMAIAADYISYNLAVTLDRPDMLDELIRRSGVGIPIPFDAEKDPVAKSKGTEERVYLGLKVGGKRRTDIAKPKLSPHRIGNRRIVQVSTGNSDLLRSAIRSGATKVVDYLAGPRPTAAFTYYAETHDDDIAQYLKSLDDLGAVLPSLFGWNPDDLNESPLLCAVIHDKLDILKQMFTLKPNLMEEALHLRCG